MEFWCGKVREAMGNPTGIAGDALPFSLRCFEVTLHPVLSQHDTPGGIVQLKVTVWHEGGGCKYKQGEIYNLPL